MDIPSFFILCLLLILTLMWFYFKTQEDTKGLRLSDYCSTPDCLKAEEAAKKALKSLNFNKVKGFKISINQNRVAISYSCSNDALVETIYCILGLYAGIIGNSLSPIGPLQAEAYLEDKVIRYCFSPEDGKKLFDANLDNQQDIIAELMEKLQIEQKAI